MIRTSDPTIGAQRVLAAQIADFNAQLSQNQEDVAAAATTANAQIASLTSQVSSLTTQVATLTTKVAALTPPTPTGTAV